MNRFVWTAGLLLACALPLSGRMQEEAPPAAVPRFAIAASPIGLAGDVRPHQYVGVVGRRAAWLGSETGEAEIWVHPLKLVSGFALDFQIPDYDAPVRGADVARRVEIRPELATITYSHATFTVRQHVLVPLDEPGVLVLLEIETVRPLEVVVSFRSVFQYAWPGAFGGQYVRWESGPRAFLLSESLRRRNAYIGSPWAAAASDHPAHALPDAPSVFRIPIDAARAAREFVPIAIAAGTAPRDAVLASYRRLVANAEAAYRERVAHAAALRGSLVGLETPDERLDLAFEWAKVNLDEQRVCNPDLGCGLVAGWGPSGRSTRPGFGWFFGGDAAINSLAMSAVGMGALVGEGLEFLAKYQRSDGKISHEVSQAAGRLPWFEEFPYAYYHADTTPYWIVAVWRHWRATGDAAFVERLWPQIEKAWRWCLSVETDGDGIIENTTGGLGAIEVGAIGERIHQDVYLAAVWTEAAEAMRELAAARGEARLAADAAALRARALATLNDRYWIEAAGHHAFGILASGATNEALTVWPATAAAFGLLEAERGRRTLAAIASSRLTTDWGCRMLASDHPLYDPLHYNMGAVWPFVTGFAAWGHYVYGRPWAAQPLVDALAQMTFDWGRGRHPELLSGAFYRPLDTAVPHQFFASSMLVTPVMRGLVGWDQDAGRRAARLAPRLPPGWPRAAVRRLPAGESRLDAEFEQGPGRLVARLRVEGPPLTVTYDPELPPGSRGVKVVVQPERAAVAGAGRSAARSGAPAPGGRTARPGAPLAAPEVPAPVAPGTTAGAAPGIPQPSPAASGVTMAVGAEPVTVTLTWEGGLSVAVPRRPSNPGDPSLGPRVVDVATIPGGWRITLEGRPGTMEELLIYGERPARVEGADLVGHARGAGRLRIRFPEAPGAFVSATVVVRGRAAGPA
jgi:glycogen debranching enzyme